MWSPGVEKMLELAETYPQTFSSLLTLPVRQKKSNNHRFSSVTGRHIDSKPPHLANLTLAKFTFGIRVATDHRVYAWRFEFKLGSPLMAARRTTQLPGDIRALYKPIRTQCESPFQPFCLCYPLFC
ncbi:hypothetical protein E2C01_009103 [Portunus trituberculatus]|uniref:Uncharacterized protein n=1 Tax=Portunus trituberculatus TaxID=210409 RepID=A0A5B7D2K5_PORTR|nr:hypothetical protein [Portunus trituberculatus]